MTNPATALEAIREQINLWKQVLDEFERDLDAIEDREQKIVSRMQTIGRSSALLSTSVSSIVSAPPPAVRVEPKINPKK